MCNKISKYIACPYTLSMRENTKTYNDKHKKNITKTECYK